MHDAVASTSAGESVQRLHPSRRVHPIAQIPDNQPGPVTSSPPSSSGVLSKSVISRPTNSITDGNDSGPPPVRLFPVSNGYAAAAAGAVVLYSATFLFYAQRHTVVLLIMTGLIGVFVIFLYALGILTFTYLMLSIDAMEVSSDGIISDDRRVNVAYLTVNDSYSSDFDSGSMARQSDWAPPWRPDSRTLPSSLIHSIRSVSEPSVM